MSWMHWLLIALLAIFHAPLDERDFFRGRGSWIPGLSTENADITMTWPSKGVGRSWTPRRLAGSRALRSSSATTLRRGGGWRRRLAPDIARPGA